MKHRTHIKVLEYRTHTSTGTYTTHRYYNTEYTQVLKYKILLLLLLLNHSSVPRETYSRGEWCF